MICLILIILIWWQELSAIKEYKFVVVWVFFVFIFLFFVTAFTISKHQQQITVSTRLEENNAYLGKREN